MHKVFGLIWWLSLRRGKIDDIDDRIDGELSLIGLSFHSFHIRSGEVAIDSGANAIVTTACEAGFEIWSR
jgi:hypothetical protein